MGLQDLQRILCHVWRGRGLERWVSKSQVVLREFDLKRRAAGQLERATLRPRDLLIVRLRVRALGSLRVGVLGAVGV